VWVQEEKYSGAGRNCQSLITRKQGVVHELKPLGALLLTLIIC